MSSSNIRILPAPQSTYVVCPADQPAKPVPTSTPLSQLAALTSSIPEIVTMPSSLSMSQQPIIMILPPTVTQASNIVSIPPSMIYSSAASSTSNPTTNSQPVIQSSKVSTSTTHSKFVPIQQAQTKFGTFESGTTINSLAGNPVNFQVSSNNNISGQFMNQASNVITHPVLAQQAYNGKSFPLILPSVNSCSTSVVSSSSMQSKQPTSQVMNLQSGQVQSSNIIALQPSNVLSNQSSTSPQTVNTQQLDSISVNTVINSPNMSSQSSTALPSDLSSNMSSALSNIMSFPSSGGSSNFTNNQSPAANMLSNSSNIMSIQSPTSQPSNVVVLQPSIVQSSNFTNNQSPSANIPVTSSTSLPSNVMVLQPSPNITASCTPTSPSNIMVLQPSAVPSNIISYGGSQSNVMLLPSANVTSSVSSPQSSNVMVIPPVVQSTNVVPHMYNTQTSNVVLPCSLMLPSNMCASSLNSVLPTNIIPSSQSIYLQNTQKSDLPGPIQQSDNSVQAGIVTLPMQQPGSGIQSGIMPVTSSFIQPNVQPSSFFAVPSPLFQSSDIIYLPSQPVADSSCIVAVPNTVSHPPNSQKNRDSSLDMTVDVDPSSVPDRTTAEGLMIEFESNESAKKISSEYDHYILPHN